MSTGMYLSLYGGPIPDLLLPLLLPPPKTSAAAMHS